MKPAGGCRTLRFALAISVIIGMAIGYTPTNLRKPQKKCFTSPPKGVSLVGMNSKRFSRIGDILPAVLKSVGLDQKLKERELLSLWPTVVGEEIAARTRAVNVDRGVLYVEVTHSAWLQELHFMEKQIYKRLREEAPDISFRRIRFTTGQ